MSIKYMAIREFQDLGYLQEANRLFFHPRGLALQIRMVDGYATEMQIWDYRDDPEGVVFEGDDIDRVKIDNVSEELTKHVEARMALFGSHIQDPFTKP